MKGLSVNKQICLSCENTGFTLKKNMHDSCLNFILSVSNPDQGKCVTLELYFTFEISAEEDAAFTFTFNRCNLDISVYILH